MKRVLVLVLLMAVFCTFVFGCGGTEHENQNKLKIWVLSDEYKNCVKWISENYGNNDYDVDITVIADGDILSCVQESVDNKNFPDVIMTAPESIDLLAEKKLITPLENTGIKIDESKYYSFAVESGKYNGKLYGMCMNASPGVFAYRRSIAAAYLGTSDPADIELLISDWKSFSETAQLLKVSSLERTYITAGISDITRSYFNCIYENTDENKVKEYFEYAKMLSDNNYVFGAEQWSEAWIQGFEDDNAIFGYFLSAIAVDDILCNVSDRSMGDWCLCTPFSSYSWGGTYLTICSESPNKEYAADLIELLTINEESMKAAALQSGIFTANRSVNMSVCNDSKFCLDVLNGQNYYKKLMESAESIEDSGHVNQSNDAMYVMLLNNLAENYINGEYDLNTAVDIYFSTVNGTSSD